MGGIPGPISMGGIAELVVVVIVSLSVRLRKTTIPEKTNVNRIYDT